MDPELQRSAADARSSARVQRMALPPRQRAALDVIVRYYRATSEPCPASLVARRMSVHKSTVQEHLSALHRKGWLRTANAPSVPTRW